MEAVDTKLVSCSVCGNVAYLGVDEDDVFYLVCVVCRQATPISYMQEQVAKGHKLKRPDPRKN